MLARVRTALAQQDATYLVKCTAKLRGRRIVGHGKAAVCQDGAGVEHAGCSAFLPLLVTADGAHWVVSHRQCQFNISGSAASQDSSGEL